MKLTFLRLIETEEDWQKTQKAGLDLQAVYDSIPVGAKTHSPTRRGRKSADKRNQMFAG
jgi:hypothetical protein